MSTVTTGLPLLPNFYLCNVVTDEVQRLLDQMTTVFVRGRRWHFTGTNVLGLFRIL